METHEIYRAALETFGEAKQTKKLFEEIGEFMEAFCQHADGRDKLRRLEQRIEEVQNK